MQFLNIYRQISVRKYENEDRAIRNSGLRALSQATVSSYSNIFIFTLLFSEWPARRSLGIFHQMIIFLHVPPHNKAVIVLKHLTVDYCSLKNWALPFYVVAILVMPFVIYFVMYHSDYRTRTVCHFYVQAKRTLSNGSPTHKGSLYHED
jgi:hypothetical protein